MLSNILDVFSLLNHQKVEFMTFGKLSKRANLHVTVDLAGNLKVDLATGLWWRTLHVRKTWKKIVFAFQVSTLDLTEIITGDNEWLLSEYPNVYWFTKRTWTHLKKAHFLACDWSSLRVAQTEHRKQPERGEQVEKSWRLSHSNTVGCRL